MALTADSLGNPNRIACDVIHATAFVSAFGVVIVTPALRLLDHAAAREVVTSERRYSGRTANALRIARDFLMGDRAALSDVHGTRGVPGNRPS